MITDVYLQYSDLIHSFLLSDKNIIKILAQKGTFNTGFPPLDNITLLGCLWFQEVQKFPEKSWLNFFVFMDFSGDRGYSFSLILQGDTQVYDYVYTHIYSLNSL